MGALANSRAPIPGPPEETLGDHAPHRFIPLVPRAYVYLEYRKDSLVGPGLRTLQPQGGQTKNGPHSQPSIGARSFGS